MVDLNTCTTGQYFGGEVLTASCYGGLHIFLVYTELALITNKPRAASVFAVGDVTCAGE